MSTEYCNCTYEGTRALCRRTCHKATYEKFACIDAVQQQGSDSCDEIESELIHMPMGKCTYFCHYSWLIMIRLHRGSKVITCMCTKGEPSNFTNYVSRIMARVGCSR